MAESIFTILEHHIECRTVTPEEVIQFVLSLTTNDQVTAVISPLENPVILPSPAQTAITDTGAQSSTGPSENLTSIQNTTARSLDTCLTIVQGDHSTSHTPVTSLEKDAPHVEHALSSSADTIMRQEDDMETDTLDGDDSVENDSCDEDMEMTQAERAPAEAETESPETETLEPETVLSETQLSDDDDGSNSDCESSEEYTQRSAFEDEDDLEKSEEDDCEISDYEDESYHPDHVNTLSALRQECHPSPSSKPRKTRNDSDSEEVVDDDDNDDYESPDDTTQDDNRLIGADILDSVIPIEDVEFLCKLQEEQRDNLASKNDVRAEGTPHPEPEYTLKPKDDILELIRKAV